MFKCCVCNKSPRKGKSDSELSKTHQDGKKAVSPVLTNSSAKIEENRTPRSEDKLNGDVQKEKVSPAENCVSPGYAENNLQASPNDVWEKRIDRNEKEKDTKVEKAEPEVNESKGPEAEGTEIVENGDADKVKDMIVEKKNAESKDEEVGKNDEKKLEETEVPVKDEGMVENENNEVDGRPSVNGEDFCDEDHQSIIITGPSTIVKTNLYNASAYIERTIDDGPDDEGDDSVFESCPNENEKDVKKAPPVSTIPRWLSEEDDGEQGSEGCSGMQEPPATPVARDELALRRHRFFSDLLQAAQNTQEHRVRFDPLGPMVHAGCETSDREEHLEELVSRLENVTRRLEKVPAQTQETAVQTNTPSPKRPGSRTEQKQVSTPVKMSQPKSVSVCNYENLLSGPVQEYLQLSEKIGGDVAAHSKQVEGVFRSQLEYIQAAEHIAAPPKNSTDMSLLAPMSKKMEEIQTFREKRRGSPYFNHLSAISESIPALGWVAVSDTPAPYVKEMNDAGQFYTNRVLKEWKEKDKIHVEWCKAWVQTLSDLEKYIRQYHTTGLVYGKGLSGAPAGVPPPPAGMPPPPPPPSMPTADMAAMNLGTDRSALFAEINQGENIIKNLKKTGSERQTSGVVDSKKKSAPCKRIDQMKTVLPATAPIDKPPVFECVGKKWLVEYQNGTSLNISNVGMNNSIYMFRCQNTTLLVEGKVNTIVLDSCYRTNLVFDSVVSSVEFVNCFNVGMQVHEQAPTISIDKTDSIEMMLTRDPSNIEIISSKSSGMNVLVPTDNGQHTQYSIPEQYKTTVNAKSGLTTVPFDTFG